MSNIDPEDEAENEDGKSIIGGIDKRLVALDLLALMIVAQLLGFTDAINAPSFISSGGFLAPIPLVPSTLGTFIRRYSIMSISWIIASIKSKAYNPAVALFDSTNALKSAVYIWVDYCSVRVIISLAAAISTHSAVDGLDLLRVLWFTLPAVTAFRVLYSANSRS